MKKTILIIILSLYFGFMQAQEAVYTSGGNGTGTGGTIGYSIGQLAFNESSDGTYTVSQGIQQPIEISNTLSLDSYQFLDLNLMAFPNPTKEYLKLSFKKEYENKITYKLFDVNGKLVQAKDNLKTNETLNMKSLNNAIYYLSVFKNNLNIKTFKIIKN